jgi:aspartyl protease family protein
MMRFALLAVALAALAIGIYLLASGDPERSTVGGGMIAATLAAAGWLLLAGGDMREAYRGRASQALAHLAIWLAILVGVVGVYAYRFELMAIRDRIVGVVMPGVAIVGADGAVSVTRDGRGTFHVDGAINGQSVRFIFDTGADVVVLTAVTARDLDLAIEEADYRVPVSTANGVTTAAPVRLPEVRIGAIAVQRVEALVARPGALHENLLGMSFLSRIGGYAVQGDRLTLTP